MGNYCCRLDVEMPSGVSEKNVLASIWDVFKETKSLGRGANGEVIEAVVVAQHKSSRKNFVLGAQYALKLSERNNELNRSCFENEVKIMKRLDHSSHVVAFIDAFVDDDYFCIVMELLTGGDLFERIIKNYYSYSERVAARLFHSMLQTVSHLHSMNLCHLDLKPENFVFENPSRDAQLKLIDLGSALHCTQGLDTLFYGVAGTPLYCAPEMFDENLPRNIEKLKECDMWSMGVVLYVMLTGHIPFGGKTIEEVQRRVIRGKYRYPQSTKISDEAKHLIKSLINLDDRLTVREALQHPWITENVIQFGVDEDMKYPDDDALAISPMVVTALRNLNAESKLRKALAKMLANQMSDLDKERVRLMFSALDTNGDGYLQLEDVRELVRHADVEEDAKRDSSDDDAERLMNELDDDDDGKLVEEEVRVIHVEGELLSSYHQPRLINIFHRLDRDKDGYLTKEDLEAFFPSLTMADVTGDKTRLSAQDFINIIQGPNREVPITRNSNVDLNNSPLSTRALPGIERKKRFYPRSASPLLRYSSESNLGV